VPGVGQEVSITEHCVPGVGQEVSITEQLCARSGAGIDLHGFFSVSDMKLNRKEFSNTI